MSLPSPHHHPQVGRWMLAAAAVLLGSSIAQAQVVTVPLTPQIGSSNPVTAEPWVPRPSTTPCVVPLLTEQEFADYTPKPITYAPPAGCPGPWAKVVFTADFTVTAGRQYDRTASFYLGHANIYYGTTAEPRHALSPSWHVERDVTDLSAIFETAQSGQADLGNFVGVYNGVTYDGIIYANAALEFYPASATNPPAHVPDIVVPVEGSGGDAGTLNTGADQITQALDLPKNVEKVYLDVIAQSQSGDEFWYLCVPDNDANNLITCPGTSFRETEVTIDGTPAGVAPVYPWIYTGGIDPYLWEPIPGVQTLNFKPYRVDLTPFAGLLSDGQTHTVGVSVFGADSYFLATANLLVYTDHGTSTVTGGVMTNTLTPPSPVVQDNVVNNNGTFTGNILVTSQRSFEISGFVNTSHGRVDTTLKQTIGFSSNQTFDVNANTEIQNATQLTTVDSQVETKGGGLVAHQEKHVQYPLVIDYNFEVNPDGSFYQTVTSDQQDNENRVSNSNQMRGVDASHLHNEVHATDTLNWDSSGNLIGPSGANTWQTYTWKGTAGNCYSRTITAANQQLTSVQDGHGCPK